MTVKDSGAKEWRRCWHKTENEAEKQYIPFDETLKDIINGKTSIVVS